MKYFSFWCGDFLANRSRCAVNRVDLETQGEHYFFKLYDYLKQNAQKCLFLKMSGGYYHTIGRSFGLIITMLDELGYDTEWQVLNSSNFGMPQNRERVFIVGHLRVWGGRKIFPLGQNNTEVVKLSSDQAHTITARYGQSIGVGSYIGGQAEVVFFNQVARGKKKELCFIN